MNPVFEISVEEWHRLALDGSGVPITLTLSGNSMKPLIAKGVDRVTVIPVYRRLKKGDIVLFMRDDGAYVCHRIYKTDGETAVTIGDACHGFDAPIKVSQIWGIISRKEKNGRETKLDSAFSRFYGIIWMMTRPLRNGLGKIKRYIKNR